MSEDEGSKAATLIATDPSFAALEASGAPIFALAGEPLRAVYVNDAAKAVFGENLGESLRLEPAEARSSRLAELIEGIRHGAAPRLERLPILIGDTIRTVTILCRRLSERDADACFVVAALGLRATAALAPAHASEPSKFREVMAPPSGEEGVDAKDASLAPERDAAARARLLERHGEIAPRFLWKTDAAGRFVDVTHVLGDIVGGKYADLLGREIGELSRALGLGPAFAEALASRKSWSGIEVNWPIEDPPARAPTILGALPIHDAARRFLGFQGYGVIRLTEAARAASDETEATALPIGAAQTASTAVEEEAAEDYPGPIEAFPESAYTAPNVVALRPAGAQRETSGHTQALSPHEQCAFDEIARTLNVSNSSTGHARELIDHVGRAIGGVESNPRFDDAGASAQAADLIDKLPVGVLVARGSDALYVNRTLLDYLGYDNLESLNREGGLSRVFLGRAPHSYAAPALSGAVEIAAHDGQTLDTDAHIQTIEWNGEPTALISFRRHLSPVRASAEEVAARALARTQARELARLRNENEEFAAAFFKANPAPSAIVGASGRIETVNAAFADLLSADTKACEKQELVKFFSGGDSRRLAAVFGEAHASRAFAATASEAEILAFDNLTIGTSPVRLTLRRLGDPPRFLCFAASPPETRKARPEADAAREEAERASAAKSAFLARVSHEIRTPLNAIIGFAEVMMEERFGPIGSERYKEYLKDVHTSGVHVLSLVNDLLDLSKIEAGKMELVVEDVDVNAIIGECVSIMQAQANQQRVVMRLSLAPRLPRIRADERSLRQILLNLLSNAVKFNEPGGQVIVSSALTDAGYVVIRVKDTGIGMSDDEIQIAMEPFRQVATSRRMSGTGLGLPVTKALIEANHASLLIKSNKNEGTLVEVAFPSAQGLAAE